MRIILKLILLFYLFFKLRINVESLSKRKLLDSVFIGIGLWFVWGCACLHGFPYKKAHLRAVFRHLNPGTRKSSRTMFPHYMRRAVGVFGTQLPTLPSWSNGCLKSYSNSRAIFFGCGSSAVELYQLLYCGGSLLASAVLSATNFSVSYLQALLPR